MIVRLIKSFGSSYSGEEKDYQDSFAEKLIAEGKAVRIQNKKLKTLQDVVDEQVQLESIRKDEELKQDEAKKERKERAMALRTKSKSNGEAE